jgi:tripartite-type tricarboxylate transporter receptor subunit TctC
VKDKLNAIGVVVASAERATPAVLADHLKAEIAKWGPVIRKAGITGQ